MQGSGNGRLGSDKTQVAEGGEVVLSGPPGASVEVSSPGEKTPTQVKLDQNGKARIPMKGPHRTVVVYLSDDLDAWVEITILETA